MAIHLKLFPSCAIDEIPCLVCDNAYCSGSKQLFLFLCKSPSVAIYLCFIINDLKELF